MITESLTISLNGKKGSNAVYLGNRRVDVPRAAVLFEKDLPSNLLPHLMSTDVVAMDLETSSLDPNAGEIALCQLYAEGSDVVLIRIVNNYLPSNLVQLLKSERVKKVFHYAVFDIAFIWTNWKVEIRNVECTKVMSRLLDPDCLYRHSLSTLLNRYLSIEVDKSEQASNWMQEELSEEQLRYAANDVRYLIALWTVIKEGLMEEGLLSLADRCNKHLFTQAQLNVLGFKELYEHTRSCESSQ